ncbi:MAG: hypothetical protein JW727_01065 [Candidatus Aenigmarchaeota archaeon]|nr:hypothetical protein [Candidatus Aenigmarchaeota archaeon]
MGYRPKGVSPVVASVLLIAFSIAIATIVGTWAMNYTRGEISKLEGDAYCQSVSIQHLDFKYDNNSQEGLIRIQNSGADIRGYTVYGFSDKGQELLKEVAEVIKKADIRTISFQTTLPGITEVMVEVVGCPEVKLRLTV